MLNHSSQTRKILFARREFRNDTGVTTNTPRSEREEIRTRVFSKLLGEKGYLREDLEENALVKYSVGPEKYASLVDVVVRLKDKRVMIIKCAPGSVVTRENQAIAAARLLGSYQVPLATQTNGEEVEVIDVLRGKVLREGWEAFPTRKELEEMFPYLEFKPLPRDKVPRESRILRLYDDLT